MKIPSIQTMVFKHLFQKKLDELGACCDIKKKNKNKKNKEHIQDQ